MLCMYIGYVGKVEGREKAERVERRLMCCLGAYPLCLMLLSPIGCAGLQAPSCCCCASSSDLCKELTRRLACAGCGRYVTLMKWNEQMQKAFAGILVPHRVRACTFHAPSPCLARAASLPEARTHLSGPKRCMGRVTFLRFPTSHSRPLAIAAKFSKKASVAPEDAAEGGAAGVTTNDANEDDVAERCAP